VESHLAVSQVCPVTSLSVFFFFFDKSTIALIEVEYAIQTIQRFFCEQTSKRGFRVNIDQTWLHLCEKVIAKVMHSAKIYGLLPLWFFDSKNKLCRYGIWLQTNSLSSHWFYEAIVFKMLTTDIRVFVYQSVLSTQFHKPLCQKIIV